VGSSLKVVVVDDFVSGCRRAFSYQTTRVGAVSAWVLFGDNVRMTDDALIERAAAEVAESVSALDRTGWAGLMLYMYGESLSAVAWGTPDFNPPLEISADSMVELGMLDNDGEAITTLRERVDGEDGWELQERFYLALAQRVHGLIGQPVLVYESALMPESEQLARQRNRSAPAAGPLAGLDVIVALEIDDRRVAAIWRSSGGIVAAGSVGNTPEPPVIEATRCMDVGSNPVVLAGVLPPGSVSPVVDGELVIANGYWLCRTNKRMLRREPEIIHYLDVEGEPFAHVVPFDGLPGLWPRQAPARALVDDEDWRITVNEGQYGAAFEVAIRLDVEEAGVPVRPIAGTVLGHRHGFDLAAQNKVWAAVAECGSFHVTMVGSGEPPERLDFEHVDGSD
jgi:hypothetical protein